MKLPEFAEFYCSHNKISLQFFQLDTIDEEHKRFEEMFKRGRVDSIEQFLNYERVHKADLKFETAENFNNLLGTSLENDVLAYYPNCLGAPPGFIEIKKGFFEVYNPENGESEKFAFIDHAIEVLEIAINYKG